MIRDKRSWLLRPTVPAPLLSALVAAYILFGLNKVFWARSGQFFDIIPPGLDRLPFGLAAFASTIAFLFFAGLALLSFRMILKPVLVVLLLVSAGASYSYVNFGVPITADLLRDFGTVTLDRVFDFLQNGFGAYLLTHALLPICAVLFVRLPPSGLRRAAMRNMAVAVAALVLAALSWSSGAHSIHMVLRDHPDLLADLNPAKALAEGGRFAAKALARQSMLLIPVGRDAQTGARIKQAGRPVVTVVVVGESARASEFALNGYGRDTDPELRREDVVSYSRATSCGNLTMISVPCMFSPYPKSEFELDRALSSESLLDVLQHAGVATAWWDNNPDAIDVPQATAYLRLTGRKPGKDCSSRICPDGVLLDGLAPFLDNIHGNTVLFLHQFGSHGPDYNMRYPPSFAVFKPECRNGALANCSHEEIVNAYDNAVLYTDHILAEIIRALKARQGTLAGAMIYLSDHGESLGENGIYMHGGPLASAPPDQTHIPFMIWLSKSYSNALGVDPGCLRAHADEPVSQDNFFPTVLGLMNVETTARNTALDLTAACLSATAGKPLASGYQPVMSSPSH